MAATATQPDLDSTEWWTPKELAERWRTSPDTIKRRIADGEIEAMPLGSQHRIHSSTIEAHENKGRRRAELVRKKNFMNLPNLMGI